MNSNVTAIGAFLVKLECILIILGKVCAEAKFLKEYLEICLERVDTHLIMQRDFSDLQCLLFSTFDPSDFSLQDMMA